MSTDFYLKMEPVKGESKAQGHEEEIDIVSFSFGATQPNLSNMGGGTGAGLVDIHDASFSHYVDLSSAYLMQACCQGTPFDKAVVTCRKAGDKPLDFLVYTFEKVLVTSLQTGGSAGGNSDHPTETFSLSFKKFTVKYAQQEDTGGAGASPEYTYDIAARQSTAIG